MPARRQNVIAKARSRPGLAWKSFCSWLSASANCSTPRQKPSVGEAVSFPYKIVPDPTMAAVAESHEALAKASPGRYCSRRCSCSRAVL